MKHVIVTVLKMFGFLFPQNKTKKNKLYMKAYVPLKPAHKDTMLGLHNRFRSDTPIPASNMEKLVSKSRLIISFILSQ